MCTISGFFSLTKTSRQSSLDDLDISTNYNNNSRIIHKLENIARKGESRGKDGIGIYYNYKNITPLKKHIDLVEDDNILNSNISIEDIIEETKELKKEKNSEFKTFGKTFPQEVRQKDFIPYYLEGYNLRELQKLNTSRIIDLNQYSLSGVVNTPNYQFVPKLDSSITDIFTLKNLLLQEKKLDSDKLNTNNQTLLETTPLESFFVHNRAIPESENTKGRYNRQPIETEHFVIIHNGIIGNDKELVKEYNLEKNYNIDTEVIGFLLERELSKKIQEAKSLRVFDKKLVLQNIDYEFLIIYVLSLLQGSYGISIYIKPTSSLFLGTNFQGLYYVINQKYNSLTGDLQKELYFSTCKEYLEEEVESDKTYNNDLSQETNFNNLLIQELPGYSYIFINGNTIKKDKNLRFGKLEGVDGLRETSFSYNKTNKGIVLASGGLDTCVVAGILKKDYNCKDLLFLHFDYGHKVEKQESEALKKIVEFYGGKYKSIKLDFLYELFKDSPLVSGIVDESGKGMEVALDYVPVRNLLFSILTASYAEVMGYNIIGTGICLSESMSYPDTTTIWKDRTNRVLESGCGVNKNIQIIAPLESLLKHEIVREGIRVGAPMNLSWSCYQNKGDTHCGICASCRLREIGMLRNGFDLEGNSLD